MRYAALAFGFLLAGCDAMTNIFAPMPGGAVRFRPDTNYLTWWRQVEECSGKRGSMRRVEWFYYPGEPLIPGHNVGASHRQPGHDVFFADSLHGFPWRKQPFTVRHEMLHDLLGVSGHPHEYFGSQADSTFGRCGRIVMRP